VVTDRTAPAQAHRRADVARVTSAKVRTPIRAWPTGHTTLLIMEEAAGAPGAPEAGADLGVVR
jgi:hypothetical protein